MPRNVIRGNRYCATLSLPCHFWGESLVSFTNRLLYPRYEIAVKGKAIPLQAWRPRGFQEFEAPRFQDNRHMKVVSLSALSNGRLYPPPPTPGVDLRATLRPEGLCQWRIPMIQSGKRTRNLPACSAVPQPTTPSRTPWNPCYPLNRALCGPQKFLEFLGKRQIFCSSRG